LDPARSCGLAGFCPRNSTTVKRQQHQKKHARVQIPLKDENVTTTILHLSDLHWDDQYQIGSVVNCNYPLCCRGNSVALNASNPGKAAKWGDLTCDIPQNTLEALLASAAKLKPDLVIVTGDNTPHDIWNQTKALTMQRLSRAAQIITKYFPNTPVVSSMGNHDTYPTDQFNLIGPDRDHLDNFRWLLDAVTQYWGPWITNFADKPDGTRAINDLRNFGFFSVSPLDGLRVVSLNTFWGDFPNWYNLLNEHQGNVMFDWLEDTLRFARNNYEKVILTGHISPADASYDEAGGYIDRYRSIFHRNRDIIVGQLYGHTHADEYNLMYTDPSSTTPTGMVYITSSVTAFGHQPGYRLMKLNRKFEFVDYDHYTTDIVAANKNDKPEWKLEYSAKSEYGLKDLSPASWDDLWHRFQDDDVLFQRYYQNLNTRVNATDICDAECKRDHLCDIVAAVNGAC